MTNTAIVSDRVAGAGDGRRRPLSHTVGARTHARRERGHARCENADTLACARRGGAARSSANHPSRADLGAIATTGEPSHTRPWNGSRSLPHPRHARSRWRPLDFADSDSFALDCGHLGVLGRQLGLLTDAEPRERESDQSSKIPREPRSRMCAPCDVRALPREESRRSISDGRRSRARALAVLARAAPGEAPRRSHVPHPGALGVRWDLEALVHPALRATWCRRPCASSRTASPLADLVGRDVPAFRSPRRTRSRLHRPKPSLRHRYPLQHRRHRYHQRQRPSRSPRWHRPR